MSFTLRHPLVLIPKPKPASPWPPFCNVQLHVLRLVSARTFLVISASTPLYWPFETKPPSPRPSAARPFVSSKSLLNPKALKQRQDRGRAPDTLGGLQAPGLEPADLHGHLVTALPLFWISVAISRPTEIGNEILESV